MDTDNLLAEMRALAAALGVSMEFVVTGGVVLAVLLLLVLARLLRRVGQGDRAKKATAAATALGLGWSAQGMLDTGLNTYEQPVAVAAVLFTVFELWLIGRMFRAHQYRADRARRAKFVTAVWVGGCVMALVVAFGEGWAQAPGRLAIPLLVVYGWYNDLTADDDPAVHVRTSLRWTPRRALLAIGALERSKRDAHEVDRDYLRDRLTQLQFRFKYGSPTANSLFRRKVRLAKLKTLADDDDLAVVRARLARMDVDLLPGAADPDPAPPPAAPTYQLPPPLFPPAPRRSRPAEDRQVQGVHVRDGRPLRGVELHDDGVALVLASVAPERPRGMSNAELMAAYDPPLKERTAQTIGAAARKQMPVNGINTLTNREDRHARP